MKSAPAIGKMKRGPVGLLTVLPSGPPAMGKNLAQWFLYCVVISIFAACLSGRTLAAGTAFLQVFRVVGIAALLGYGAAHAQESTWNGRSCVVTFKHFFEMRDLRGADRGNIRLVVAEIALTVRRRELYGGRPRVFSSV
jgi:hypothetical protein